MNSRKIAIVTGGGSGIGFAIARKFTENGLLTYITGRNLEKLENAQRELGDNCRAVPLDMEALGEIPGFVQKIAAEHGRIDVLVNNAGINLKKPFTEVTDEDFQKVITTNLTAVFALSREVAKVMLAQKSGSIIHISSMAAQYGLPKVVAYSASKTALEGMARAMASELSPQGIRVNCIAPGFIVTAMTSRAFESDPGRKNRALARTPMGKMGDPVDIANAAWFLASDESTFVTGEVLKVDGGNSIGF
ncbi:MAG: SDR family oxidoreductase [Bacteroidetes bacterium]|nr:SDR family oxidoreductase [Bacteroidota bacterium]